MIKVSTKFQKFYGNFTVFRKSLEHRWGKKSKFLRNLPSEQIFYRNIPFGAPDALYKCIIDHIHDICQVIQQQCFDLTSAPLFFYQCPLFQWCNVFFCPLTPFAACPSTINGTISAIKLVTRNAASKQAHTVNPSLVHLALTVQSYERDKRHAWRHISMQKSARFFRTTRKPRKGDF